jgi:peptidyl-tRNA hydrolase, PTH1 family
MQIIIGLGNPGTRYSDTWHNLGFHAVDSLAARHSLSFKAGKGKYYAASGFINFKKVVLVKPTTYMNLSGIAVAEILNYFEAEPSHILVVYDDINLNLGTIRIRKSGTAGGHNGIKSIIGSLDTLDFPRLRIGFRTDSIAEILSKNPDVLPDLVLAKIPSVLREEVVTVLSKSVEAAEFLLENGIEKAMNTFNGEKTAD